MLLAERAPGVATRCETWPAWNRFKQCHMSPDGRVIDARTSAHITTSANQSYALFFALVANDRAAFDEILRWTQLHLAGGDLENALPARRWGRTDDGELRVLGADSASDADLWLAYSLGEAARLWHDSSYSRLGDAVARNILRREVANIPGLGTTLLPAVQGLGAANRWRLNASYLPLPVIRGIARQSGDESWADIVHCSEQVVLGAAANGFCADWLEFTREGFIPSGGDDADSNAANRVYLWAGMLPASDPTRDKLAAALKPMLNVVAKRSSPIIGVETHEVRGEDAPGFSAALLPMLASARLSAALQVHRKRAAAAMLNEQTCDSDLLTLFGLGWLEQRYRFSRAGLLNVRWTPAGNRPH
jgi:endoglucanase